MGSTHAHVGLVSLERREIRIVNEPQQRLHRQREQPKRPAYGAVQTHNLPPSNQRPGFSGVGGTGFVVQDTGQDMIHCYPAQVSLPYRYDFCQGRR